jgi:hypothetical protein
MEFKEQVTLGVPATGLPKPSHRFAILTPHGRTKINEDISRIVIIVIVFT